MYCHFETINDGTSLGISSITPYRLACRKASPRRPLKFRPPGRKTEETKKVDGTRASFLLTENRTELILNKQLCPTKEVGKALKQSISGEQCDS